MQPSRPPWSAFTARTRAWDLSNEGGPLENPWNELPKDMFEWTTEPGGCAGTPRKYVGTLLPPGHPERINGAARGPEGFSPESLNELGA